MANIYHQVLIQAERKIVYDAVTTQAGLSRWWVANCNVKSEISFIKVFHTEGHGTNFMKVLDLEPDAFAARECTNANDAWSGTNIKFTIS